MSAAASNQYPYVEVNLWLPLDKDGYYTNSLTGGVDYMRAGGNATVERCGHVSMKIFENASSTHYVSFWPGTNRSILNDSFDADKSSENNTKPDVIIRLHKLDVPKMLQAYNDIKSRVASGQLTWAMRVATYLDATSTSTTTANCASMVYSLLKVGGFDVNGSVYFDPKKRGPSGASFYSKTKCDAGDILWGAFSSAFWMDRYVTPKTLLLKTAEAAERNPIDKADTISVMGSNQVQNFSSRSRYLPGLVPVIGAMGTIAFMALRQAKQ